MKWHITDEAMVKITTLGNEITIDLQCIVGGGCCAIDQYLPIVTEGKPADETPFCKLELKEIIIYYPQKLRAIDDTKPARITASKGWFPHGLEIENVQL
ncbi:hypothetical protein F9B85_11210 [Heliorestis acidaminivorans]|uniref:Uncharacterized protein n=1 Tax=Heliorestis acidaminivorans TaxID=553427 RepID=A0A6I0EPJ6_9FIRM|nr:CC/Se motif family (seleno)protein [Heliorestis acidaminivorans]KAB2951848.1 hypothetical protein F9B85_11210 [Heliorestis acidaminivorans]